MEVEDLHPAAQALAAAVGPRAAEELDLSGIDKVRRFPHGLGAEAIDPRRRIDLGRGPGRRGGRTEPCADAASGSGRAAGPGYAPHR